MNKKLITSETDREIELKAVKAELEQRKEKCEELEWDLRSYELTHEKTLNSTDRQIIPATQTIYAEYEDEQGNAKARPILYYVLVKRENGEIYIEEFAFDVETGECRPAKEFKNFKQFASPYITDKLR